MVFNKSLRRPSKKQKQATATVEATPASRCERCASRAPLPAYLCIKFPDGGIWQRVGVRGSWAVRRHLDILAGKGFLKQRRYRKPRDIAPNEGGGGALAA